MSTIKGFRTSNAGTVGYQDVNIAAEFSTSKKYTVGDYVMYDGSFYVCKTAITTTGEAWDSSKWTKLTVGTELSKILYNLNNLNIELDDTLSIQGQPADAKAVGDAIRALDTAVDTRIDGIDSNLTVIGSDLDTLKTSSQTHDENIESLQSSVGTLETFKTTAEGKLTSLEGRADDLETFQDTAETNLSTLNNDVDTLKAFKTSTTSELTSLDGRIDTLEDFKETTEENLSNFETMNSDITDLKSFKITANQKFTTVDSRLDNLKSFEDTTNVILDNLDADIDTINSQLENLDAGMAFDSGYQDENGYIHLTLDGEDLSSEDFTPFYVAGGTGGSDSGSRLTFASYTATNLSIIESAGTAPISFRFTSVDTETSIATGDGYLTITVGNTVRANLQIAQGDRTVDVFEYLVPGNNTVKLSITDSYGLSKTRTYSITIETFNLTWSLQDVSKNTNSTLSFNITPVGSGNKTIYTYVDGTLSGDPDLVTTSGRRLSKTISNLSHGAHTIEVYGKMTVNGSEIESNHLYATIAQIVTGQTTPVIAVNWPSEDLQQYTTARINYLVVDPLNNPAAIQFSVNNEIIATDNVDQSSHVWSYRPAISGEITLSIRCLNQVQLKTVTVTAIQTDATEITDGLQIKVDPATISDITTWSYNNTYSFTLSDNFDLINGGIVLDDDGVRCIRVTAGDRLTLNYTPFNREVRNTGLELKIIYAIRNSSLKSTTGISCMSNNNNIGFRALANNAYLRGNQTEISLSTCEDEKVELDINIQQRTDDALMYMYESCSTFSYDQYASESENFTHTNPIIFGSDDAEVDIYLIRGYSRDLTDQEILANYICDGADGGEILNRQTRNSVYDSTGKISVDLVRQMNPNAHIIIINAERMTETKKDGVTGTIDHTYLAGGAEHNFHADMTMKVQGTSSQSYVKFAGANLNFELSNIHLVNDDGTISSTELTDGYAMNGRTNSIPTKLLTWKKNVASQEHVINRLCAKWYNDYQPSIREARRLDKRIRDCLESAMCVVFFHNTSNQRVQIWPDWVEPNETVFYGLGNLCSNKDAVEVFDYDPIVIEVKDNITPLELWKSDDISGSNFDGSFEFRYLDEDVYTEEQAKALWQQVLTFVKETDYTTATDELLPAPVVINGQSFNMDSAAYRKAKWKAECANYFDMDTLYWHYNITLFFLLRDNRAKNMFWSYNPTKQKWGLWFNWDNDTGLCRNNEGYVDIEPGYLDYDMIGTSYVYNGATSALFSSLRENNMSEIQANYIAMESKGAWNSTACLNYCDESQGAFCEALWLEDAEHKGIRVLENLGNSDYLARATGKLRLHIRKALKFQKALVDSYFIANGASSDRAIFRGYSPENWQAISTVQPSGIFRIKPYTNIFVTINVGPQNFIQRADAGEEVVIDLAATLGDTPIWIYSAEWIQEIGDMSPLYLGEFNASALKRVKKLLIGSDTPGYYNTNFTTASFDNCKRLEELNMGGLVNANRSFDLTKNLYLKKIYTMNSGVTGLAFATNGRLQEAKLNALTSLTMKGLTFLETFEMQSYNSLSTLVIEDCYSSASQSYQMVNSATNLQEARLIGINWTVPSTAYRTFMRLYGIGGIDDDNSVTTHSIVKGNTNFITIGTVKYNDLVSKFPDVTFTYETIASEYAVTFMDDDGNALNTQIVEAGQGALEPVSNGLCSTPTKDSTVEYTYTFSGWDKDFSYIINNTTVIATFTQQDRYYTVNYNDVEGQVLESYRVKAHGSASFKGVVVEIIGRVWTGWSQMADDVISDMNISPTFITPMLPSTKKNLADYNNYAYSDDSSLTAAYTQAEFAGILLTGNAANYFNIGTKIRMIPRESTATSIIISDENIDFVLVDYSNHFKVSGTSSFANTTWASIGLLNQNRSIGSNNTNGWPNNTLRNWLNNTWFPSLPPFWKSLMKKVEVLSSKGGQLPSIVSSDDYIFLPSATEIGFYTTEVPYINEIDSGATSRRLAYFTDSNSRTKKLYNNTGSTGNWWTRSPYSGNSTSYIYVTYYGSNNWSSGSMYIIPCFCI